MGGVTRRTCITMGAVPVVAAAAAYATREGGLWPGDDRPRFAPAASPREALQRKHLPNEPILDAEEQELVELERAFVPHAARTV